ncbi:type II CRISPR RNA-guided endonuclease Cas9 [Maricaulis sp.]|uniref:type II CRISPR RNA-guided endonuclease Cas9 n=1 Tax=Maricaulis sp. TaxID=1486257 RepID=UPI003A950034
MTWRLGLDVGTNSIGWAVLDLDGSRPRGLQDAGVRIFSDGRNPKDGSSLAVQRRGPRGARRTRDRYIKRRDEFLDRLVAHGLMPTDLSDRKSLERLDPWTLRASGLDEALSLHELGRALFHLQQRRGFQSNRKTDRADSEKGAIAEATARTLERLEAEGARTIGELFGQRRIEAAKRNATAPKGAREPQPAARVSPYLDGNKLAYDYYPTRDLIRDEFNQLWNAQAGFHGPSLPAVAREALADTLFFQRPLRAQPVGKCSLDPTKERAPKALPSVQRFRILQEANNLTVRTPGAVAISLTREQRDAVVEKLLNTSKVTFDSLRSRVLKLPKDVRFNLESDKRRHLDGDATAAVLAAASRWGTAWRTLPLDQQDRVVERLLDDEDETQLIGWLQTEFGLSEGVARAVSDAPLPDGHSAICREVTAKLIDELSAKTITYDKAVERAGYHSHSRLDHHGEILDHLPYYGTVLERHVAFGTGEATDPAEKRYGKVANPTVHVALNQIRRVVNALVDRYGPPAEIVVELARDLPLSAQGRRDLERRQKDNQAENDRRRTQLAEHGQADTYQNRLRLRLWEELNPADILDRRCPFTGEQISIKRLFSDEVEIDHILPRSRTLDDSPANKTVAMRQANREKMERSPWEAFGHSPPGYDWEQISARAANMPGNKAWRFAPDAMERFDDEESGFMDRQLRSTQYIARLASSYLVWLVGDPAKVWVTPGRLTSDLRHHWGLNSILAGHNLEEASPRDASKNRNDHRHHAIDAIVTALTDRALLQGVATEAGKADHVGDSRLIFDLQDPWANFRDDVASVIDRIVVSHKPNHGVQGALHNDTAYGLAGEADASGKREVVHRVPLASLASAAKLEAIRDPVIRSDLQAATAGLSGKDFANALVAAGDRMTPPVRKVRIVEAMKVLPISDRAGRAYKAYKGDGNYCYDIFADATGRWTGEVISRFDANQSGFEPQSRVSRNGVPLIMRLCQNDTVAINDAGVIRYMRVAVITPGKISLSEHHESNVDSRNRDATDSFSYIVAAPSRLQKLGATRVRVDPAGRVFAGHDPSVLGVAKPAEFSDVEPPT